MSEQQTNVTPERLMQFAFGYAPPLMIETAIQQGVFDLLAQGAKTAAEVSRETGASERGVRILLDGLTGLQLLAKEEQGRYALTPESATFLVSSRPGYHGGIFRHTSSHLLPKWTQLSEVVRTGRPGKAMNQQGDGVAFFAEFVESLFPMSYRAAEAVGKELRLAQAQQPVRVLDIAAGSGVWGIALAHHSPQARVTAVDWPEVLEVTRRVAARNGVADRFTFLAGDILEADFGTGYHVATLGHILHSEGEARSRALLRKVADALAPGGTIAIGEMLTNAERTGPPHALIFAVNMLVNTEEGDTFSFEEISDWLREAGFENPRLLDAPAPSPLVLATKPA